MLSLFVASPGERGNQVEFRKGRTHTLDHLCAMLEEWRDEAFSMGWGREPR